MSAEDRAALQRLADTVEDRTAGYLRRWVAMPEFRAALQEHARVMRETVREEMRADRDAAKSRVDRSLTMLEGIAAEQKARLSN